MISSIENWNRKAALTFHKGLLLLQEAKLRFSTQRGDIARGTHFSARYTSKTTVWGRLVEWWQFLNLCFLFLSQIINFWQSVNLTEWYYQRSKVWTKFQLEIFRVSQAAKHVNVECGVMSSLYTDVREPMHFWLTDFTTDQILSIGSRILTRETSIQRNSTQSHEPASRCLPWTFLINVVWLPSWRPRFCREVKRASPSWPLEGLFLSICVYLQRQRVWIRLNTSHLLTYWSVIKSTSHTSSTHRSLWVVR